MSAVDFKPRLCHIEKSSNGYGFHLHGEKGQHGQFIRKIESGTPAETSGLKQGDRVVEVNGKNVEHCNHQEVVSIIKEKTNETFLLVVDSTTDQYFQENNISITQELVENGQTHPESNLLQIKEASGLRPRLIHLVRGDQGFGFNLHSDRSRKGRYIRTVEKNGPAETGGLKPNDRLIEVNGINMQYDKHQAVVAVIRNAGQEVELLVVDEETDKFFKSCGVVPTTEHLTGPLPTPLENPPSEPNTPTSPTEPPAAPATTPATENPPMSNGVDLMKVDLETLKKMSRSARKKPAPSSNWNNRQAIFNNL